MSNPMVPTRPFGDSTNAAASTEFVQFTAGGGDPTNVDVRVASQVNVRIPDPNLPPSGFLSIDGVVLDDGDLVFLPNQTNKVQNGIWEWDQGTETFSRSSVVYTSGSTIHQPYLVSIAEGDTFSGQTFKLNDPFSAVVDITPTEWVNSDTGSGLLLANQGVFGPLNPGFPSRPSTARLLSNFDIQPYDPSLDNVEFPQTIFDTVSKVPRISDYIDSTQPWKNADAINNILAVSNTLIIDCPVYLTTQINGPFNSKRIIFLGSGETGAIRVQMASAFSFWDNSGCNDIIFEGFCRIHYPIRATAGVKAIKGTTFNNLRIENLYTSGVDFALNVGGTISGLQIDEIGVENSGTDTALLIAAASAPGAIKTNLQRITGRATYAVDATGNGFTYVPWVNANVINLTGAEPGNRVINLSLQNATEGYRVTFLHNATGGFNYAIGGLKTIVNGQAATLMISNGVWVIAS